MNLDPQIIAANVAAALTEDIGTGDLSAALVPSEQTAKASIITREAGILCGIAWAEQVFKTLDPNCHCTWYKQDGESIGVDECFLLVEGNARALLSAERSALNFLQLLSGVATRTREYVTKISHTKAKILDTRKTLPGLRFAQKYAVACGGGHNHRIGLYDAFLIKENHIMACGGIAQAAQRAREMHPERFLEVEVEDFEELRMAIETKVPRILLDNFTVAQLHQAVALTAKRTELEASGSVTLANVQAIAETGVNYISIGDLTKKIIPLDLSMRFVSHP